eukprot:scaffold58630_cov30-Tisochrysis_lutea.AAC.2
MTTRFHARHVDTQVFLVPHRLPCGIAPPECARQRAGRVGAERRGGAKDPPQWLPRSSLRRHVRSAPHPASSPPSGHLIPVHPRNRRVPRRAARCAAVMLPPLASWRAASPQRRGSGQQCCAHTYNRARAESRAPSGARRPLHAVLGP